MQDVISLDATARRGPRLQRLALRARSLAPTRAEALLISVSVILLVLSFPDFDLWPLAWIGFVPLIFVLVRAPLSGAKAFVIGWAAGTIFFYATCYWLSHAMIHYGGLPAWLAYLSLTIPTLITGIFPGLWAFALARISARWNTALALALAPFLWAALEWARLGATGQLWNAVGYSQAYVPELIQTARWGGVYLVGFLIVSVNAAIAFLILKRNARAVVISFVSVSSVALVIIAASVTSRPSSSQPSAVVVGVQPNVAVERTFEETQALMKRHVTLSAQTLDAWEKNWRSANPPTDSSNDGRQMARIVVWPESPMNFRYARDSQFRDFVSAFAREHRTSVIFNALEPAAAGGYHNSAVMINEEGRLIAQYDKIRLLPFGEYVPLPRWFPPAWLLEGIAGDFTPGADYPLMPLGDARTGVFICFESAFPSLARRFARDGADVLINISNDGYLGRTPVIKQHLANVVFRAVESGRPILRVTNTGISAMISPRGEVKDATRAFEHAARAWTISRAEDGQTVYTWLGDAFAALCLFISALALASTFDVARIFRPLKRA